MILWQREPTLNEMLSDPLILTVMRADGVDPETLAPRLRAVGRVLERARSERLNSERSNLSERSLNPSERSSSFPRTKDLCCAA